jgi:RNA polymerase sigma factor (TIGR02999 family)
MGTLVIMSDVTRMLSDIEQGNPNASEQLLTQVYEELRRLATQQLANEKPGQTLKPNALVHEAYLRLIGPADGEGFANRWHFYGAASEAMRRILVDQARRKNAEKRGSNRERTLLNPDLLMVEINDSEVLDINEALTKLAIVDEQAAQLVQLRYFGGLTMAEAAQALNISSRSADRLWAYAKAWLFRELSDTFLA